MADCGYWEYQISLSLDGELGPDAHEEMVRHLGKCPRCRSVKEAFERSAQALRALPDLADPDLLAGLKHDILQKTYHTKRKSIGRFLWPAFAAALIIAFAAANLWLGPLWQRPALVAAAVAPGNRLELTFNQSMDNKAWPGSAALGKSTAGPLMPGSPATKSAAGNAPQAPPSPTTPKGPVFGTFHNYAAPARPAPVPPYTVTRQGKALTISFAGPLPQGPVQILVPATLRDRWGRELGRAYLLVIDHGKITIKNP